MMEKFNPKEFCDNFLKEAQKHLGVTNDSDLTKMSRKEFYEYLFQKVSEVIKELDAAKTEASVNKALDKLTYLMDKIMNASEFADVTAWTVEITSSLNRVKLHSLTIDSFEQILQAALSQIEGIIKVEEEKEHSNAAKLRTLFLVLADHSEEIAKIIKVDDFFG